MEPDYYDNMYWDDSEDPDYYDVRDTFDGDLIDDSLYGYAGSDAADDYYDERDDTSEYLNGRETVDDGPENDADDLSHNGSNENFSLADDSDPGEDFDGSDNYLRVAESIGDDYDDDSLEQRSDGTLEDAAEQILIGDEIDAANEDDLTLEQQDLVVEVGEIESDNQSELSCESQQEVYADAENDNRTTVMPAEEYDYEYEEEDYDLWDDDIMMNGAPWDDSWDDAGIVDDWYDYYYADEASDEDTNGRYELQYEDYGGEDIPGEDGVAEASDSPDRDNFATPTAAVDPPEGGNTTEDPAAADNKHIAEGATHSCPICLDKLDTQEVGSPWNCQHYFCINCIVQWVHRSNTCPVDRDIIFKIAVRCKVGSPVTRVILVRPLGCVAEETQDVRG